MVEHGDRAVFDPGSHVWEHRLFLIFAPSPEDVRFVRQTRLLEGVHNGFAERDLVRGEFFEDGAHAQAASSERTGSPSNVPERYGVEPGRFAAVLVGKDGTVKYRSGEPVEPGDLYARIDAMPMRRREVRERER